MHAHFCRVSDPTVRFIRPILATKRFGVTVGGASMSDRQVLRFRIQRRDPLTVQALWSWASKKSIGNRSLAYPAA